MQPKYLELPCCNYTLLGILCEAAVQLYKKLFYTAIISVPSKGSCHCLVVTTTNGTPATAIPHNA
jgi:hypothetical protein